MPTSRRAAPPQLACRKPHGTTAGSDLLLRPTPSTDPSGSPRAKADSGFVIHPEDTRLPPSHRVMGIPFANGRSLSDGAGSCQPSPWAAYLWKSDLLKRDLHVHVRVTRESCHLPPVVSCTIIPVRNNGDLCAGIRSPEPELVRSIRHLASDYPGRPDTCGVNKPAGDEGADGARTRQGGVHQQYDAQATRRYFST
jgi:hypothetical protein